MENIFRLWDSLKPGETVLIEHDSMTSPSLGLYYSIKWARERGYRIVVDDVLDTLYLCRTHLKLAGYDVEVFDDLDVIKEGGVIRVGKVLAHLHLKQHAIRQAEYRRVFEPLLSEKGEVLNIVLGIEKLFLISDMRENMNMVNSILNYTGDERRIALYFINGNLLEVGGPHLLPLLEELSTTVIRVSKDGKRYLLSVLKSVNNELDGIVISIP